MIKKYSDLIILTIIWIVSIYSTISIIINPHIIGIQVYMGYIFIILVSILWLLKIKKFKIIFGFFLVIGSVNAIQFTYSTISIFFNESLFMIQPLSLSLLILYIIFNFADFKILMTDLLKKESRDILILSFIWIVSIYSLISIILNSYVIGIQNYVGYGLLILISILRFYKIKKFKTVLGIFLLIGSVNGIQFTYSTILIFFNWTPPGYNFSSFGIQPLSFFSLILLIIFNFSEFIGFINDLFSEDPSLVIERQKRYIAKHYDELKNEKDNKLHEIIDNKNMYQAEYVRAARQIIEERKNNKNAL